MIRSGVNVFLTRRRRHVRRCSRPGAATPATEEAASASASAIAAATLSVAACLEAATPADDRICGDTGDAYARLSRPEPHSREDPHLDQRHHHLHHHHHHQHSRTRASRRLRCCLYTAGPTRLRAILAAGDENDAGDQDEEDDEGLVERRRKKETAKDGSVTAIVGRCRLPPYFATLLLLSYTFLGIADACSSRSTPRPRPPTPSPRPNVTFQMYTCPPDYAEWYCLNGATCFTVKIVDSLLYNCLCANGYIGQRCEFKDLDGSYLPSRQRVMLETASIAGGATIAVFLVVIICIAAYIHCKRKQKELRTSNCVDTVDGPVRDPELRPFTNRSRSLMIFMAKNPYNLATVSPPIEHTRMLGFNYSQPESTTRMASISEGKSPSQ